MTLRSSSSLLCLLAVSLILQACNPSGRLPAPSGGSPHGYSRSSAVAASALTGEIAFGAADGHIWVINAVLRSSSRPNGAMPAMSGRCRLTAPAPTR
jgi:hypothetical protein